MFVPRENNLNNGPELDQQEQLRRQQIMRLGIILCLMFLLFDGGPSQPVPTTSTSGSAASSVLPLAPDSVLLSESHTNTINRILLTDVRNEHSPAHGERARETYRPRPFNVTGLFRGLWSSEMLAGDANKNKQSSLASSKGKAASNITDSGSMLMQLKSIPVRGVADLTFVYGVLRLYGSRAGLTPDTTFPLQGVLVSSQQRLTLFSTPYTSQKLYLQLHNASAPTQAAAAAAATATGANEGGSEGVNNGDHGISSNSTAAWALESSHSALPTYSHSATADAVDTAATSPLGGLPNASSAAVLAGIRAPPAAAGAMTATHAELLRPGTWDSYPRQYINRVADVAKAGTGLEPQDVHAWWQWFSMSSLGAQMRLLRHRLVSLASWEASDAQNPVWGPTASFFSRARELPPLSPYESFESESQQQQLLQQQLQNLLQQLSQHDEQNSEASGSHSRYSGSGHRRLAKQKGQQQPVLVKLQPAPPRQRVVIASAASYIESAPPTPTEPTFDSSISGGRVGDGGVEYISVVVAESNPHSKRLSAASSAAQKKDKTKRKHDHASSTTADQAEISATGDREGDREADGDDVVFAVALAEDLLPRNFKLLQRPARPVVPTLLVEKPRKGSSSNSSSKSYTITLQPPSASGAASGGASVEDCDYVLDFKVFARGDSIVFSTAQAAAHSAKELLVSATATADPPGSADRSNSSSGGSESDGKSTSNKKVAHSAGLSAGAILKHKPATMVGGVMESEPCGRNLVVYMNAYDFQVDTLRRKVEVYALLVTGLVLAQIFLLIHQLRYCSTLALTARASIFGMFAQSLLDAVLCMAHLLMGAAVPSVFFSSFIWIAVLKLLLFSVFQMRFIINIYQARYSQEIAAEGWHGFRRRLVNLHLRFYGSVVLVLLLIFTFPTLPVLAVLVLYSFWVPQIVYSAYSGTKHPFSWTYLLGTACTRAFVPLYVLGCPHSFAAMLSSYYSSVPSPPGLPAAATTAATATAIAGANAVGLTSPAACYTLVLWLGTQLLVLYMQQVLGPRFFVPKRLLPVRYDYHRPVPRHLRAVITDGPIASASAGFATPMPDSSSSLSPTGTSSDSSRHNASSAYRATSSSSGSSSSTANLRSRGHDDRDQQAEEEGDVETGLLSHQQGFECVICYNSIFLNNRNYMITPCDHVFHTDCLTQWINVKLECPVCRASLPVLEEEGD